MRVLNTLWISLILSTAVMSASCGSLRDGGNGSDASDATSTDDPSDPTNSTDVTDPSDVSDTSDSSDPSSDGCDADGDGDLAEACGGTDCQDDNEFISGQRLEICDFIDNNCDQRVNEGLDCTIYVHTSTELFKLDPFTEEPPLYVGEVPGIVDFDTSSDGSLYGISSSDLYSYESTNRSWSEVGTGFQTDGFANGFAIDQTGVAYISAGFNLYRINLYTGLEELIGDFGSTVESSGDLVINKDNSLFMTSRLRGSETTDKLVVLNPATGTPTVVGDTGFDAIFGLAFAWGNLFGFTDQGEVLLIDPYTAATELLVQHDGYVFYGSASSPER